MSFNKISKGTFFTFLFLSFFHIHLFSQQMTNEGRWKVNLDGALLDYRDISDKFEFNPNVIEDYIKSVRSYKASKGFGLYTLGAIGTGFILLNVDSYDGYCDLICLTTAESIGVFLIVTAPLPGTIGLLQLGKAYKHKKSVIRAYNQHHHGDSSNPISNELLFGITENGVGLVFRF